MRSPKWKELIVFPVGISYLRKMISEIVTDWSFFERIKLEFRKTFDRPGRICKISCEIIVMPNGISANLVESG